MHMLPCTMQSERVGPGTPMNSVNASTGFSNIQLQLGHSPWIIPPLVPITLTNLLTTEDNTSRACGAIEKVQTDVAEAKDNLLLAKIFQAHHANIHRSPEPPFQIGDKVMLSALHHHQEFKKKGEKRAAKFFPCYDGPYNIIDEHAATSNYTLELPNNPNTYPTYHTSKLKTFVLNDPILFTSCKLSQPLPILTPDGLEEFLVQEIQDSCHHGQGWQYLIQWVGYSAKHNHWLSGSVLEDCEALDRWFGLQASGKATQ